MTLPASANSTATRRFALGPYFAIAAGAGCFLLPALINGFPFVFPDSLDYLIFTPLLYRSPFYGLFIFFFHLNWFIWGAVVVQAVIASHLIWVLVRVHAGRESIGYFAFSVVVLSLFSSLPFFVGFIMADFFTPIMILVMYLLGFQLKELSGIERLYFLLLACVAIAAHVSHVALAVAVISIIIALHFAFRTSLKLILTRAAIMTVPLVLAASAVLLNNVVIHRAFSLGPASASFLLANMIEYGPARHYLEQACPAARYKICKGLDGLPSRAFDILWGTDTYQKLGGFEGMREEAGAIVFATIRAYPLEVVQMAVRSFGDSFALHAPGAEFVPLGDVKDYWMKDVLKKKFPPWTLRAYEESLQWHDKVPRTALRAVDNVTFPAAMVALLVAGILAFRRGFRDAIALAILVPAAFIANNALCAFLSGVYDRYQARVTWLFALAALLIICELRYRVKTTLRCAAGQGRTTG